MTLEWFGFASKKLQTSCLKVPPGNSRGSIKNYCGLASLQIIDYDYIMTIENASALVSGELDWLDLASGEDANVDRPVDALAWDKAPSVTLEAGALVFRYPTAGRRSGNLYVKRAKARPDSRLLTRFIELADASDDKILAYARQYGRLGLCEDGELQHLADDYADCIQVGRDAKFVEQVERWRENVKRVRALLNAIAQFSKSRKVSDRTLIALSPKLSLSAAALRKARIAGWSFIAAWTQMWLRAFRVRPVILYDPQTKRFHARLRGRPGLGSALALQLMTLACQSKGIAICSSCGRPFPPKRRPNPTRESYCPKCGIRAAWRDAQRRRRQKT